MKVISCLLIWLVLQQASAYQEDQEQMTIQAPTDDSTIAKSEDMNAINDLDSTMDTSLDDQGQLDPATEQGQTLVEQTKQPMKPQYINGWTEERVRNTKHGSRPDPSVYLSADYIKQHLEKFKYGASFLTNTKYLDSNGRDLVGRKQGTFVMTKAEMDQVLKKAAGKLAVVEKDLGIPKDAWKDRKTSRIDVYFPMKFNPRLPNGNEPGANELWIPGGLLPTGYSEAIIDQIPRGEYNETNIIFT